MSGLNIAVLGAGAWGTALAIHAARQNNPTVMWSRTAEQAAALQKERENRRYLAGRDFPDGLVVSSDCADLGGSDCLILAVPAQHLRGVLTQVLPQLKKSLPLILCAKGVEIRSGLLMTEMIRDVAPAHPLCVLSGPSFAGDVAKGLPTAVTLAAEDSVWAAQFIESFASKALRIYDTDDIIGAEIGGAVKNVIAIACGVVEGRGLGDSARAALIARGLSEMMRLGLACGGRAETLVGLSGLGDLTLTCTAHQSRNYAVGFAVGQGESLDAYLASRHSVAEGVPSAQAIITLAHKRGVDLPICQAVFDLLHQAAPLDAVMTDLLNRPQRAEPLFPSSQDSKQEGFFA